MFEDFDDSGYLDSAHSEFEQRVPHGEEAFMVLKAHLLAERAVIEFVRARIVDAELEKQLFERSSPCRNGLPLIFLAQALSARDEVPHAHAHIIWPALKMLNNIRNTLAHELDPNSDKLKDKIREFNRLVSEDMSAVEADVNKGFRKSAELLFLYLHIDQKPLFASDID